MAMVVYFNMSESAALSAFPSYLRNIPKQWYFQLNDLIKSSLESLKNSFFKNKKILFYINILNKSRSLHIVVAGSMCISYRYRYSNQLKEF